MYDCTCGRCKSAKHKVFLRLNEKPDLRSIPGCVDFYIEDGNAYFEDIHGRTIMVLAVESFSEIRSQEVL